VVSGINVMLARRASNWAGRSATFSVADVRARRRGPAALPPGPARGAGGRLVRAASAPGPRSPLGGLIGSQTSIWPGHSWQGSARASPPVTMTRSSRASTTHPHDLCGRTSLSDRGRSEAPRLLGSWAPTGSAL